MGVTWTKAQKKVIELRNRNILVSAAAGSGKTAVLVERIITMVTDLNNPIDIDRLLVVTFTNAAAAEMRERVLAAIEKKMEEFPDNEHLQKQLSYIHNAQITTIHSFCLNVIRNHFNATSLDPAFRVGEEGELKLLRSDVMTELLESYYEDGRDEFFRFVESYSSGKTDAPIEELILKLYSFSMSYPWPEEWLELCRQNYDPDVNRNSDTLTWMTYLKDYISGMLSELYRKTCKAIEICDTQGGPYPYREALLDDKDLIESLMRKDGFDERKAVLDQICFTKLSAKRDPSVEQWKKEEVKLLRSQVKDGLGSIKKSYYFQSMDEMMKDICDCYPSVSMLVELTNEFSKRYAEKKAEHNLIDFNDIEHLALRILVQKNEEGILSPTAVADEYSEFFAEIMVDEYQDSNLVQETILQSVTKDRFGKPNLFMVGDVKQSIYKFRLARPELFMDKYEHYDVNDGPYQRITLDQNFRSRGHVLQDINYIFGQIMAKYLGNIDYDEENALHPGASYPDLPEKQDGRTELILINEQAELGDIQEDLENAPVEEDDSLEATGKELEARLIAKRIKELTHPENGYRIVDKKTGEYRVAKFSDIVILLRTISGWGDTFTEVLMAEGIPAYAESQTGYFTTLEIQTILNMLKVMDNPRQDIPLAAVLKSPIAGLSSFELAEIRMEHNESSFYEGVIAYAVEGKDSDLKVKLNQFLNMLEYFRTIVPYTGIYDLLNILLDKTGYFDYITSMPSGRRRRANIEMLKEKAVIYETTSYQGLFHFIRYVEKLQKYEVDFGEAVVVGENDNTVRIMSIHKSKGLEFPIVFVSGLGKKFNQQDTMGKIVIHPDLGIGTDYLNPERRIKCVTLVKRAIQKKIQLENQGEELRVLYVALTRAKEKLILTGCSKSLDKKIKTWFGERNEMDLKLSFGALSAATSYLDLVGLALVRHASFDPVYQKYDAEMNIFNPLYQGKADYLVQWYNLQDFMQTEIRERIVSNQNKESLLHWNSNHCYNEQIRDEIKDRLKFEYPYKDDSGIYTKMSVSEIKKQSMQEEEEVSHTLIPEAPEPIIPNFLKEAQPLKGAARGTAFHRFLELFDYRTEAEIPALENFVESLVADGKISVEMGSAIRLSSIVRFLKSDIGQRMKKSFDEGLLKREQQFVMGIPAKEFTDSDEIVLIQGILDAYFEENGEYVIVDYKTDRVNPGEENILVNRYQVQLDYYQRALEQITGRTVKERIIYSFALNKEIKC